MQRLFSTFPGGWPGIALLLLRSTAGSVFIAAGVSTLVRLDRATLLTGMFAATAAAGGLSLLLGLFTPVGGVLGALCSAAAVLFAIPIDTLDSVQLALAAVVVGVMAAALGLLGPGAFSIDCCLFGRRKIVIPQSPRSRDHA
jgi:putative oxidoreductase